jgi:hypothetical protein
VASVVKLRLLDHTHAVVTQSTRCHVGLVAQADAATHAPLAQIPLAQSPATAHDWLFEHFWAQLPPQSASVSLPFLV